MKKCFLALSLLLLFQAALMAQDEKKGFQKEKLFTGGSISLSFFNGGFLVGGSPVFGYNLTRWADVGLVGNYSYSSYRDYDVYGDRLKQTVYGGGAFTRLFPVRFLFVQGQFEHNWVESKLIAFDGRAPLKDRVTSNSVLLGGGYTTGRDPQGRNPYAYFAILVDVLQQDNSPYVAYDRGNHKYAIPIIRAGFNIPLFQGRR